MMANSYTNPWVSFCISTYKRPTLLNTQLLLLLDQTNKDFEIVVSDNDPESSARKVVEEIGDPRIKYFHNEDNLGMIRSFNKSIERATTEFIVMVTDDDPVDKDFLYKFRGIIDQYPQYSLYGGFVRENKPENFLEIIEKDFFLIEILDPLKTSSLLWSSCILRRTAVLEIGRIPDFGSPHLADHALLVLAGSVQGGVVVNKMYSSMTQHAGNFSKFNFEYYTKGCKGFYDVLTEFVSQTAKDYKKEEVIVRHLGKWFISNIFNLKRYYYNLNDTSMFEQVNKCGREIISFPFMRTFKPKYHFKQVIFFIKAKLGFLSK